LKYRKLLRTIILGNNFIHSIWQKNHTHTKGITQVEPKLNGIGIVSY